MKKNCSFTGCKSGTASDRNRDKVYGKRHKTLFKFPKKGTELRKMWEKAVGREVNDNEVLCELHFRKEDVIRHYQMSLANGDTFTMDRGKVSLQSGAVPQLRVCNDSVQENENIVPVEVAAELTDNSNEMKACEKNLHSDLCSIDEHNQRCNTQGPLSMSSENSEQLNKECTISKVQLDITSSTRKRENPLLHPLREKFESNTSTEAVTVNINSDKSVFSGPEIKRKKQSVENPSYPGFSLQKLSVELKNTELPHGWAFFLPNENFLLVGFWSANGGPTKREFHIYPDGGVQVFVNKQPISMSGLRPAITVINVLHNIAVLQPLLLCDGTGFSDRFSTNCAGHVRSIHTYIKYGRVRCTNCTKFRQQIVRKKSTLEKKQIKQKKKCEAKQKVVKNITRKCSRLKTRMDKLKLVVKKLKAECAKADETAVEKIIEAASEEQRETVRMCLAAAKCAKKGVRYTKQWIYECMLMRIKSPALYNHLRSRNILPLPHVKTIDKYIRLVGSAYGFNEKIFQLLKQKARDLSPAERRGTLLIDEMKLSKGLRVDRKSCQLHGFVNLGDHTPDHQKNELGDHALVFMYQPFRGRWVQAVACFLSKGAASSNVLECLVLECISLLENSGFHCDVVTTDGATWNRGMWGKFNVPKVLNIDTDSVGVEHPCDSRRKLWFCSDFPHLIKNFRNAIVLKPSIWTPDGVVKLKHWETVMKAESHPYAMKVAYKLTKSHIHPKYYQKMNVPLALQLFSERVSTAMKLYANDEDLQDSEPTVKFIERIDALIKVMMSRAPKTALKLNSDGHKIIRDFLTYLNEWEASAKQDNLNFITDSTCYGLKITLKATLEILHFLTYEGNYEYLMTVRLNQDALERFFGMARGVCGSNDHPDATLFGQMFCLLSTYSLVKPAKGSNVSGGEMIETIINVANMFAEPSGRQEWEQLINDIVQKGKVFEKNEILNNENLNPDSDTGSISIRLITYMAGYVIKNRARFTKCSSCIDAITATEINHQCYEMITLMNRGYLTYPSFDLILLLRMMEETVLKVVDTEPINSDTIFQILYTLQELSVPLIGCPDHMEELTRSIMNFFIRSRAEFLVKSYNVNNSKETEKTKKSRKDAKL